MGSCTRLRCGLIVALLATLVAAAIRCFGTDARELAISLQDDSFYYLLSAWRAWQHGGVLTFDGEHAMFGVQPAYAAVLALIAGPCPDRDVFLRVALFSSFVLYGATALVVARCVRLTAGSETAGVLAGVVWLLNVSVMFGFTTLKENVLYAPLFAVAAERALVRSSAPGVRFGALLGLSLAARLTPSSLLLAVVLAMIALRGRWRAACRVVAGGALACGPFVVYGLATVGRAMPTSGSVKTLALHRAIADGSYWHALPGYLGELPGYLLACANYSLGLAHGWFHVPQSPPPPYWAGGAILLLAVLGVGALVARQELRVLRRAWLLLLAADVVGQVATYLMLRPFGEVSYFQWYVAATPVLVAMVAGLAGCAARARAGAALGALLAAAAAVQVVAVIGNNPPFHGDEGSWARQMLWTTARMNDLLPRGVRVGSANAGRIGYFAREDLAVVNLDGLANDDWYDAMRAGESLRSYLDSRHIDYACDVLTAGGFGRHALADLEPLEVTPFHGPEYDGHFLVRRADVPFPDCWPLAGERTRTTGAVVCVPWIEGDPIAATAGPSPLRTLASGRRGIWASWRCDGATHGDGPAFLPGGTMQEMRAWVGGRDGALVVRGDGAELARIDAAARSWAQFTADVHDAARVEVEFVPREDHGGSAWLAGVTWAVAGARTATEAPGAFVFGNGCAAAGEPPQLTARLASTAAEFVLRAAPRAAGLLVVSRGARPTRLSPPSERLPCTSWLDGDQLFATLPFVTDGEGRAKIEVALPTGTPARLFAQAMVGLSPGPTSFSNGLRLSR